MLFKLSKKNKDRITVVWALSLLAGTIIALVLLLIKYADAQKNPITVLNVDRRKSVDFPEIEFCHQSETQLTPLYATYNDGTLNAVDVNIDAIPSAPVSDGGTGQSRLLEEEEEARDVRAASHTASRSPAQRAAAVWSRHHIISTPRHPGGDIHSLQTDNDGTSASASKCFTINSVAGSTVLAAKNREASIVVGLDLNAAQVPENGVLGVDITMRKRGESDVSYIMASGEATMVQMTKTEDEDIKGKKKHSWTSIPGTTSFKKAPGTAAAIEGFMIVVFTYQTLDVTEIKEKIEYDFMSFFGEWGGWAGVLLGVSFIQVVDLFSEKKVKEGEGDDDEKDDDEQNDELEVDEKGLTSVPPLKK